MEHALTEPRLSHHLTPGRVDTPLGPVEYLDVGDGPPVVSLHGAMGGCDQSLMLVQTVGDAAHRYLAVSRPGYLGTPLASGRSPQRQADLVAALLDASGIDRAGVIAVSGGGPCAVQFGLRHRRRCAGLVLISTVAVPVAARVPISFKMMKAIARGSLFANRLRVRAQKDPAALARRAIRDPDILARTLADPTVWPLFSTMLTNTYDDLGRRLDGTDNDIRIARTANPRLEDLTMPVLVVHGTDDRVVDHDTHVGAYAGRVPGVEVLSVAGGEHVAIFTHRVAIRARVVAFMRRHFGELRA